MAVTTTTKPTINADKSERPARGEDRGGRGGDREERGGGRYNKDDDDGGGRRGGFSRKKVCRFCSDNEYILDYKDVRMVQSFISEHGKITPRRITGNCALHQRALTTAVKRARNLALVGYVSMGN